MFSLVNCHLITQSQQPSTSTRKYAWAEQVHRHTITHTERERGQDCHFTSACVHKNRFLFAVERLRIYPSPLRSRNRWMPLCTNAPPVPFIRLFVSQLKSDKMSFCMYRGGNKGLYVVARNFFLLLLNCSAWPCLGPA